MSRTQNPLDLINLANQSPNQAQQIQTQESKLNMIPQQAKTSQVTGSANYTDNEPYIDKETIEKAENTAEHINMIDWDKFDTGESLDQGMGEVPSPANDLVTEQEFYTDMFNPLFKTMSTISGYKTFTRASENKNASKIIYKKIANNKFTRFVLMPGTQNYIDTVHLVGFIASIVFGVVAEKKAKQDFKNNKFKANDVGTEKQDHQAKEPVVKSKTQTEEDIQYVPEVA